MVTGIGLKPDIGLKDENRQGVVQILNTLLSDEFVLYTRTRKYHWNVVGPQFNDLRQFFEQQYTELNQVVDEVAERSRMMGGTALGTLSEFLEYSRLDEHPCEQPNAYHMLTNLLVDHEAVIRYLRADLATCAEKCGDMGTNNFLTDLMERHEKMAWMLRSYLGQGQ